MRCWTRGGVSKPQTEQKPWQKPWRRLTFVDKSKYTDVAWFKRAINKNTPTTEANETIRTASFEQDGKIYLVPTIRLIDGKLTKIENPLQYALDKGDFLTGFKNEEEATEFSKTISNVVDMKRNENKRIKWSTKDKNYRTT